ncbi:hypothetical protein [Spirochaeta africana]|uniref:Lipocalin-like domain-containing protein n=1 Tax=Spirochaeta africana (strain ATCC 700263 / DSM 8902 / Z-7692) TaxID=889378 RepID=H9UL09_SPIAZ|nr:hypothetical protein [Spirochaeta africana]AFG38202.1 hypothetical protein Spiaf_2165 [Spirochaeta africana DSM 8902]
MRLLFFSALMAITAVIMISCNLVTPVDELVLDDSWELRELKTGSVITTDLDEWLTVSFDRSSDEVSFATGATWDDEVDIDLGSYEYEIDSGSNEITLYDDDGDHHSTIGYRLESAGTELRWDSWVTSGDSSIVGNDGVIAYLLFERND